MVERVESRSKPTGTVGRLKPDEWPAALHYQDGHKFRGDTASLDENQPVFGDGLTEVSLAFNERKARCENCPPNPLCLRGLIPLYY